MRLIPGFALLFLVAPVFAQEAETAQEIPPAREEYLGRKVAQTMHWLGADWLLRETREKEENTSVLYRALGVKEGWTVADVGCGAGYHVLPLARQVGEKGRVFAVDIQEPMLKRLAARAKEAGVENVVQVHNPLHDAKLPEASCDLILLVDVYHEFSHPVLMLESMRRALKPKGLLVLVEFRAEDPKVPIKPLHKMSEKQIRKELEANRFQLVRSFDDLPWQHCLFFGRDDVDFDPPREGAEGDASEVDDRSDAR